MVTIGFSTSTWQPAASAREACSQCRLCGVAMTTPVQAGFGVQRLLIGEQGRARRVRDVLGDEAIHDRGVDVAHGGQLGTVGGDQGLGVAAGDGAAADQADPQG